MPQKLNRSHQSTFDKVIPSVNKYLHHCSLSRLGCDMKTDLGLIRDRLLDNKISLPILKAMINLTDSVDVSDIHKKNLNKKDRILYKNLSQFLKTNIQTRAKYSNFEEAVYNKLKGIKKTNFDRINSMKSFCKPK